MKKTCRICSKKFETHDRHKSMCYACLNPISTLKKDNSNNVYQFTVHEIEERFLKNEKEVKNRVYSRICPLCSHTFNTRNFKMIFCCEEHAIKYLYEYIRNTKKIGKTKTCLYCGKTYEACGRECFCTESCRILHKRKQVKESREKKKKEKPEKKKKKISFKELRAIQDREEKKRLFNDSIANAYIKTGKGFNIGKCTQKSRKPKPATPGKET